MGMPLRMALNLSTRELRDPELSKDIDTLIHEVGLTPDLVELEITDRVVMSSDDLPDVLARLKGLGVRLAIDDFGTGSSVLSRLQHCPVDILKIDRSFISNLTDEAADTRLVHALISMAHALGLAVVGEGIETTTQAAILRRYGCEFGQGYVFCRPTDADSVTRMVTSNPPNARLS
jgi:EAL domain-containing protein (putative c-di-GMP-specific phosphodiesterase class I)